MTSEPIMEPPDSRFTKAFDSMRSLGVSDEEVKPVLNGLLKLYDGNWELIEEDNYRTLIDAYFETKEDNKTGLSEKEINLSLPPYMAAKLRKSNKSHVEYCEGPIDESSFPQKKSKLQLGSVSTSSYSGSPAKYLSDIAKGSEIVKISLVDESGSEDLPKFNYIPHNIIYQSANVNISLARIADQDCCSDCSGDCLLLPLPCACSQETGGQFAYTPQGVLREDFLKECVSMKMEAPQDHNLVYCQECPLERSKKCKGHLVRKFIKECWRKCGCDMQCGNRVVQRGLRCKLQVFLTKEGKGWGVRTLEDLPKGCFVCEYAGEILTNSELYERTLLQINKSHHTYSATLDADWGSEKVLKDEEALCLDATFNGNVVRFINHRCFDANLIDVPVEVETPDRHYYHLALFTNKNVKAYEELTWDYGIDFDDHDHPIKAFKCCCGSNLCRDKNQKETKLETEKRKHVTFA